LNVRCPARIAGDCTTDIATWYGHRRRGPV